MDPKVHVLGRMAHSQGRRLVFAFLLAGLISLGTASAAIVNNQSPIPVAAAASHATLLSAEKEPLPLAVVTDYVWHGAEALAITSPPKGLLEYPYTSPDTEQPGGPEDVTRHRGFGKALLIIIACGALIRLLSSPAYLKFIADVLDPKVF
jgi:hypothetical protein